AVSLLYHCIVCDLSLELLSFPTRRSSDLAKQELILRHDVMHFNVCLSRCLLTGQPNTFFYIVNGNGEYNQYWNSATHAQSLLHFISCVLSKLSLKSEIMRAALWTCPIYHYI